MASNVLSGVPVPSAPTATSNRAEAIADGNKKREQLKKATQQFESVFIGTMLKEVHKSLENAQPLFGNSFEAKFYQEMMDEQVADRISQTGAFGLGNVLYKSLEKALPPDPTATPQSGSTAAEPSKKATAQSASISAPSGAAAAQKAAVTARDATAAAQKDAAVIQDSAALAPTVRRK